MRRPDLPASDRPGDGPASPSRDNLAERQVRLPDGHPSSPAAERWPDVDPDYAETGAEPDEPESGAEDPAGELGRERGESRPRPGPDLGAVAGAATAREPYRPWFADGGPAEPWFAAEPEP
jgi:hypothetical protein